MTLCGIFSSVEPPENLRLISEILYVDSKIIASCSVIYNTASREIVVGE
jgi:hypothetical protein